MLVLTRKAKEVVIIGGPDPRQAMLIITVLGIENGKVRLGFEGDAAIPIHRLEVWRRIQGEGRTEISTPDPALPSPG
jgi:carbon storage regulator CsrA